MTLRARRRRDLQRGRLVAFEGGEGSGKSTQASLLAAAIGAVLTREPGGTDMGERVRALLLEPSLDALDPRAEALLMAAARAQHVAHLIEPTLGSGRHVVTDRFVASSLAYQGAGRGLPLDELRKLSEWATQGLSPDLTVLLEVPPELGMARAGGPRDRLESAGPSFHSRVADAFRSLASEDPVRWAVVDGEGSIEEVARRVRAAWDALGAA